MDAAAAVGIKDVTAVLDHYRMSARSVWNTAFWPDPDFRNWESFGRFEDIARILFDELVLVKLDGTFPLEDVFQKPIPFLQVDPASPAVPIMIQREGARGYWDDPVDRVERGKVEMHFIGTFDWNQMDYRDLQCYRVSIAAFEEHPHLVGREALVERQYVKVFMPEQAPPAAD